MLCVLCVCYVLCVVCCVLCVVCCVLCVMCCVLCVVWCVSFPTIVKWCFHCLVDVHVCCTCMLPGTDSVFKQQVQVVVVSRSHFACWGEREACTAYIQYSIEVYRSRYNTRYCIEFLFRFRQLSAIVYSVARRSFKFRYADHLWILHAYTVLYPSCLFFFHLSVVRE